MSSQPPIDILTGYKVTIESISVDVLEKIGTGTHSHVYKAVDSRGANYALKAVKAPDDATFQRYVLEYEMQKKVCSCQNIVSVFCQSANKATHTVMTLMELCTDNLESLIRKYAETSERINTQTIVTIFQDVCAALHQIHSQPKCIIHRGVQASHVFVNHNSWKLANFNHATTEIYRDFQSAEDRIKAKEDIEGSTSLKYRAPELLDLYKNIPIYMKVDVWAVGCLLFRLCTLKDPFETLEDIQNVNYSWPENIEVNPRLKAIVKRCFDDNPSKRPSIDQILHKLFEYFPDFVNPRWEAKKQAGKPFFNVPKGVSQTLPSNHVRRKPIVFKEFKVEPNKEEDMVAAPRKVRFTSIVLANGHKRLVPLNGRKISNAEEAEEPEETPDPKNTFAMMNKRHAATANFQKMCFNTGNESLGIVDPFAEIAGARKVPFVLASSGDSNLITGGNINDNSSYTSSSVANGDDDIAPPESSSNENIAPKSDSNNDSNTEKPSDQIGSQNPDATQLIAEMKNDHRGMIKRLLEADDALLSLTLSTVISASPILGTRFLFKLIHKCGNTVQRILKNTPKSKSAEVQAVLDTRLSIASRYPMFEGNFGLDAFKISHKEKMPLIGEPPICAAAAVEIQQNLQTTLALLEKMPHPEFAEEGICTYQILSYIILKLKQAKRFDETIANNVIPLLVEQHGRLKPIVRKLGDQSFPSAPYNFDDPNSVRHLHCPTYIRPPQPPQRSKTQ